MIDLDELAELVMIVADEVNDEVRPSDCPSAAWLKSFRNKLQMALEEKL